VSGSANNHRFLPWALVMLAACGQGWEPSVHDEAAFPLECGHAAVACESCHEEGEPLGRVDDTCVSCHELLRPASHDPGATHQCNECHTTCSWDEITGASPHPEGYDLPSLHGLDANLQVLDCGACHGEQWEGGSAQSCDGCHEAQGAVGWRTDCTFCHGGEQGDTLGMPPEDLDDTSDPASVSFRAHGAHADPGGVGHVAYDCGTCHRMPTTALSAGHAVDSSPGVAEVPFGGLAMGSSYSAGTCTTWCHGDGVSDGQATDDGLARGCDDCHSTEPPFASLSGAHGLHLNVDDVVCASCHAPVVDAALRVTAPDLHVDGQLTIDVASGYDPASGTCTVVCHGHDHGGVGWEGGGHPPGYDAPEQHGTDALFQASNCRSCHGADLQGGTSGQGCDDCHGPGWRSDCTFCHGGQGGDTSGLPPEDLDNTTAQAASSFDAHREHADGQGHPRWDCTICHDSGGYADALLDAGHWLDATPGVAEVGFSGAPVPGGSYAGSTCSNLYCHGDGQDVGTVSDGSTSLACSDCHPSQASGGWGGMSGFHSKHMSGDVDATCSDCHASVVDPAGASIVGDALHVDGTPDVDLGTTGLTYNGSRCSGSCHGDGHTNDPW